MSVVIRKNIVVVIIGLTLISASVFASKIPPNWTGFGLSALIMIIAVFYQRRLLKIQYLSDKNKGLDIKGFADLINSILNELKENKNNSIEKFINVYENQLEKYLLDIEDYRLPLTEELGSAKYTELISSFAKAERSIQRCYSAAIDGYGGETRTYCGKAIEMLENSKIICERFTEE